MRMGRDLGAHPEAGMHEQHGLPDKARWHLDAMGLQILGQHLHLAGVVMGKVRMLDLLAVAFSLDPVVVADKEFP